MSRRAAIIGGAAAAAGIVIPSPAASQADGRLLRIVSTSGVPHGDVADYRKSPAWRTGMPKGANKAWRTYMRRAVAQITAGTPDVVLHQGDMVEGRWYTYLPGDPRVYGARRTWAEKTRMVHRAADTIYPWMKQWWAGHDVLWAVGDHEIGDIGPGGVTQPGDFRYKAHWHWKQAWRRHFGPTRYAVKRGPVGIITLDPFVKWNRGVLARIRSKDLAELAGVVEALRADGCRWIVVQCEIPAVGPNRPLDGKGTSGMLLENGGRLWDVMAHVGVDLFLTAEFHADTTHTRGGRTPVQVVHGGRHMRTSWLTIDVYQDRLELVLRHSVGAATGKGKIWAPTRARVNNRPVVGSPRVTGRATVHADGSLSGRTGRLTEGV